MFTALGVHERAKRDDLEPFGPRVSDQRLDKCQPNTLSFISRINARMISDDPGGGEFGIGKL